MLKLFDWLKYSLTTGFWGKEAWRPTPKWNTRIFFAFSKRTRLWLPYFWRRWENSFRKVGKKVCPVGCLSLAKLNWDSQQGRPFSLPFQRNFAISFKHKVAIHTDLKDEIVFKKDFQTSFSGQKHLFSWLL